MSVLELQLALTSVRNQISVETVARSRAKAAYFFTQRAQVALEVSAGHQLHDHQRWLSLRHHAQEPYLQRSQHCRGKKGASINS